MYCHWEATTASLVCQSRGDSLQEPTGLVQEVGNLLLRQAGTSSSEKAYLRKVEIGFCPGIVCLVNNNKVFHTVEVLGPYGL